MSGIDPPLYCTLTLIATPGHQTQQKTKQYIIKKVVIYDIYWLSASHDLRLGMDGMLLALSDHGFERSG